MPLSLRAKFTLTTALLVLAVVALTATVYVATITHRVTRQAAADAQAVAQEVLLQAQHALRDAESEGRTPGSNDPAALREFVRRALEENEGLSSQVDAALAHSPSIYEVTFVDRDGVALVSSDASLPGRGVTPQMPLEKLVGSNFLEQLRVFYGPPRVYEVRLPFNLGNEPYGEIRIGLQTGLMREIEIGGDFRFLALLGIGAVVLSTLVAAGVSHVSLAPLARIVAQLDRIREGEFEPPPARAEGPFKVRKLSILHGDEFGLVSRKITQIGEQLRGVREIFSTLRENLDQFMAGLEDGLLLFTREGRAVMVSPAVEKFLGTRSDHLLGQLVSEIFPPDSPVGAALGVEDDTLKPIAAAEIQLDGAGVRQRVRLSVQLIAAGDTQMGALVTLRNLESLEQITSQLQVSERLAALGRVTAGVAHEVKNPLNSMRLWLESLKESLPSDQELPREAVRVLDSEIDRLDRVVKSFLDFTRPVELRLEETSLAELLTEAVAIERPRLERAGVEVVTELPDNVPGVVVDRGLIKQALLNLIANAIEAMPQGGRLTLRLARRGEMAQVSVTDTGCGIPGKHRARIFQLLFTTRPGGSGIGLATTYKIVQHHNGSIDFESEEGRGTTFRIELPLAALRAHAETS